MCCFSRPVQTVSNTRVFARLNSHLLSRPTEVLYSMKLAAAEELAMVLPLPVPRGSDEDAVRFINLEAYPSFFDDLLEGFKDPNAPVSGGYGGAVAGGLPALKVHDVGRFEASFVPRLAAFARLDPRFRLTDQVWDALPQYRDWGFAVFKLKPRHGAGRADEVHPMAFEFPLRERSCLFFPTVHVHDGVVHETADFDHVLFAQLPENAAAKLEWKRSYQPASAFMRSELAQGTVEPEGYVHGYRMYGSFENRDQWLRW